MIQPPRSRFKAVDLLLAAIFLAFIAQNIDPAITTAFMFDPNSLRPWMFVTSMFLHANFIHIFFNAYALWMFGPILEKRLGFYKFMALFFLGGIAGSLGYYATILAGITPAYPALGASGAIYAVLGAMAVLTPELVVLLFGIIPLTMAQAAVLWVVLEVAGTFNTSSGIASAAHLGGLILGFAWGKWEIEKAKAEWRQKWR